MSQEARPTSTSPLEFPCLRAGKPSVARWHAKENFQGTLTGGTKEPSRLRLTAILEIPLAAFEAELFSHNQLVARHFGGDGFAVFVCDLGLVAGQSYGRRIEPDQRPRQILRRALGIGVQRREVELRMP